MKKEAFSLALTLWIVAIMSLASALYLSYAKSIVLKSKQLNTKLKLIFEAESIVEIIKFYGSTGEFNRRTLSNTLLGTYLPSFPKVLYLDSKKMKWKNSEIILQDSAGLINLEDIDSVVNYIVEQDLKLKDKKDIIKSSVKDWLDRNNFSTLNGAEDSFYSKYMYKARSEGYISSVDELFLIRGLDNLNNSEKERIKSSLVLSFLEKRNAITMSKDILKSTYNLSQTDVTLLDNTRVNPLRFMSLFNSMHKENYDIERDGFASSKIVKAKIISSEGNISKKIEFLIDFSIYNQKAFAILNYKD